MFGSILQSQRAKGPVEFVAELLRVPCQPASVAKRGPSGRKCLDAIRCARLRSRACKNRMAAPMVVRYDSTCLAKKARCRRVAIQRQRIDVRVNVLNSLRRQQFECQANG